MEDVITYAALMKINRKYHCSNIFLSEADNLI
jgi:hypothetical protein